MDGMLLVRVIGFAILGLGALIVWINFYTSFVRYPLHRLRGGTRADFHWVSGFPLVGSLLLALAILFFGKSSVSWVAVGIGVLDTGGLLGVVLGIVTIAHMILFRRTQSGTKETAAIEPG